MTSIAAPAVAKQRGRAEGFEFVALITATMAMAALAIDLMLPAFAEMRIEYGMPEGSPRVSWVITAFFLGMSIGPWLFGPASDRFGRRPLIFLGIGLYLVGAAAATFAPSFGWLIAARFLWGIGASGPRSLTSAMIRDRYEGEAMARLMSTLMAIFIIVPIAAPALGAALLKVAPWRAVFAVPAIAALIVMVWGRRLPETLAPENRRPLSLSSIGQAAKAVVTNRTTVYFGLAVMFLFGVMTGYLSSSELIVSEVYGHPERFPLFFGAVAILLGLSALNNARLVTRLGIAKLVQRLAISAFAVSSAAAIVSVVGDGKPPFWLFAIMIGMLMPMAQGIIPNSNAAAMAPVPHVAGTAAAILGTASTAGGALLGSLVANAFDGTTRAFFVGVWMLISIAAGFAILGCRRLRVPSEHG